MKKPIIGIVCKQEKIRKKFSNVYIREEVKDAIIYNGGIPIGIINVNNDEYRVSDNWYYSYNDEDYKNLYEVLKLCDGVIFQGGNACSNYEMNICKYCYDLDIPVLGICCGENVMVRCLGGTTKLVSNPDVHHQLNVEYVHSIKIKKNTKLYNIIKKEEINVNSRHLKVVDTCPNLCVSAIDSDGNIECVEDKNKKFFIGLRFHPESLYLKDENMNNIFVAFIDACKK